MPHSDDSVPRFTSPPFLFSSTPDYPLPFPLDQSRCDDIQVDARARGARENLEEKNGGSGDARVCEFMCVCLCVGGGLKVDINDSFQMSLIHYCIVREML